MKQKISRLKERNFFSQMNAKCHRELSILKMPTELSL